MGSWVQTCRYLHQWQRKGLSTQDRHLGERRKRHKSENLGEPITEGLRLLGLAKHFLVVRKTTLKHSGRANLIEIHSLSFQVLSKPRLSGLLPFTQVGDNPGCQGPHRPPSISTGCCSSLWNRETTRSGVEGLVQGTHER